jgi:cystathionine gamma-synthase
MGATPARTACRQWGYPPFVAPPCSTRSQDGEAGETWFHTSMTLDRSTIWPYEDGEPGRFYYSRYASPTIVEAEEALGALEGGHALLYPSGSAATSALVLALLQPGDTIALAEGCYFGTGVTFQALAKWGIRHVEFDQTQAPPEGVQLVWLEAPSNPYLTMPDLEAAAAHPAPVVVDSTVATPVHLRPLEHGADFALHSATKYLAGHDDALLGAVACRDETAAGELRRFRTVTGIVAAPDPAFLLLRGLKTLELRVARQTATAGEIAERLRDHPAVETVRWPGLGGLISFDVADNAAALRVETSTRLIVNATSLGGVTSVMESRARWEGERVPPGLLRLSVGLEDPEALWRDLDRALAS